MNSIFGSLLRNLLEQAEVKESQLAEALNYDTTYISKWINGSKLPAARTSDRVLDKMSAFFADYTDLSRDELFHQLKKAYDRDSSYQSFQSYNNNKMSFLDNHKELIALTRDALFQMLEDRHRISLTASFDLFRLYGTAFKTIIRELHDAGAEKVVLKLAVEEDDLKKDDRIYAAGILGCISCLNYIEMSVVCRKRGQPKILIVEDLLCLQLLWNKEGELGAIFSTERDIIEKFYSVCAGIFERERRLLDPAPPENLRKTNTQLDSYSDRRQWLFYNESPALLFPDEIMDFFADETEDEDYRIYLMKLKNIFRSRTRKSKVDLVLYSSAINDYLRNGRVCVGNVEHKLSEKQVRDHFRYLSAVMEENPEFKVWLIRDTVTLKEELREAPSIFIDTHSVYIENSQKSTCCNFHISTDPVMRKTFENFFEEILSQSYCNSLTGEDLLRYL